MTQSLHPPVQSDRYKSMLIFLAILNTVVVVFLAALQSDATIRATLADRDSQYYAVSASGELHRSGLASNYDFMVLAQTLKNQQDNLVLMMTALEQQIRGENNQAVLSQIGADSAQAQADAGRNFSILFTDPRFAPKELIGMPNVAEYLVFINADANNLVTRQNQAADDYQLWNKKSDDYAMILTIISIAFLLFGVGQAVTNSRLRLFFAIFGGLIQAICILWALVILIQ